MAKRQSRCILSEQPQRYISSDGLPDGEIVSIAEDFGGRIWAGSSVGQIAFFSKGKWHRLPNAPCQEDAAINQILMLPNGTLWLATPVGIFAMAEGSSQWTHYRPSEISGDCIENYVTCIARQDNGDLFFGLRKAGFLRYSPAADEWRLFSAKACGLPDSFVSCILPLDGGQMLIGTYGGGLFLNGVGDGKGLSFEESTVVKKQFLPTRNSMPVSFSAETEPGQIHVLLEKAPATEVAYLGEDWQTQGEWIGKYGSYAYVLAAMGMPNDYVGGEHADEFHYVPYMGANRRNNDSLRYWTHRKNSSDPRSLQCPVSEHRRQSSWDDAGENYPPTQNGPDVLFDLELPPGNFLVSLYFVNIDILDAPPSWRTSDGFPSPNRFRDFLIEVTHASNQPDGALPVLASTRVTHFGAGVYKRFQIQGGRRHTFRVARNQSHNTLLSAIFIDKVTDVLQHSLMAARFSNPLEYSEQTEDSQVSREAIAVQRLIQGIAAQFASSLDGASFASLGKLPQTILPLAAQNSRILVRCGENRKAFAIAAANQLAIADLLKLAAYPRAAAQSYAQLGKALAKHLSGNGELAIDGMMFEAFRTFSTQLWHAKHQPYWGHFKTFGWNPMDMEDHLAASFVGNAPPQCRDLIVSMAVTAGNTNSTSALSCILWKELEKIGAGPECDSEFFARAKAFFYSRQYRKAAEDFAACAGIPTVSDNLKIKAISWQYYVATVYLDDKAMAENAWKMLEQLNATERFAVEFNGVEIKPKTNEGVSK